MRAKRSKKYRKLMHQYSLTFSINPPFQVLLDADIIKDAAKCKMRLGARLEDTLQAPIKPFISQCCIRHLYNAPASTDAEKQEKDAWIAVAKSAERRYCGHHELEEPLSARECLESVVDRKRVGRNVHKYVVASQDAEVRQRMREIVGTPVVYIRRSVMILEPMAGGSEEVRDKDEKAKMRAGLKGRRGAQAGVKRKRDDEEGDSDGSAVGAEVAPTKKQKSKGPKEPNPLSMKKSKKEKKTPVVSRDEVEAPTASHPANGVVEGQRSKRKRKRKPDADIATVAGAEAPVVAVANA